MGNSTTTTYGVGLPGLLTVAFVVLKLCGVIGWTWWWVLAPIWLPLTLFFLVSFIAIAIKAITISK
jgi:hypothetical protein